MRGVEDEGEMPGVEAHQLAAQLMFWGALAVLCYTYFGYPALLGVAALVRRTPEPHPLRPPRARRGGGEGPGGPAGRTGPSVTVVVAAWNEAGTIADKIENTLGQSYPAELLEMVVVSDGSTDGTDEIVQRYAASTGRVRLLRTGGQQGKSLALNLGVPEARGEIVVLTDANATFAPDAVERLVGRFADPRVGAVSGELKYRTSGGLDEGEGAYWRYEQRVKLLESAGRRLFGANGSIYAIRKELFRPLHPVDVNDLRIPYEALLRGYAVVLEPAAVSYERPAPSLWGEYRRKVRIMSRAIPTILRMAVPAIARGRIVLLWQLVSHKLLREIQAIFFAGMLVGAGWGAMLGDRVLSVMFAGQLALYLGGALAWAYPGIRPRVLGLAAHFDMIVLASYAALGLWLTGRVRATWQPARSAQG
ncbi:MAG: glycosyltransferase family 2 protein [Armatimonadota bacterium]